MNASLAPGHTISLKALLLENIHPSAVDEFKRSNIPAIKEDSAFSGDSLSKLTEGFSILGIRSKTRLSAPFLESARSLYALGCFCIGTDQVDLLAAKRQGIPVFNAPYSNTRSVAELVLAEIVALSRKLGDLNTNTHLGVWNKSAKGSFEVRGKTLGIIGFGHIGSQVSILAEAFGMNVIFFDIEKKLPLGNSKSVNHLNDIFENADFITLHVPDTPDTRLMISEKEIESMKSGVFILNLSRGRVVDLDALVRAIRSEKVGGAAVDVFPEEPESNKETFSSPLQGLPNVILTPHVGGSTEEAQEAIGREVALSLINHMKTGSTYGSVNFPQVSLPRAPRAHRLINVHKNVPGVLSEINSIVSEQGVNIAAQALATDNDIGYLIMDVEAGEADSLAGKIQALATSIKTRVIY